MRLLIYKENSTNCYFSIYLLGWETLVNKWNRMNKKDVFDSRIVRKIPAGKNAREKALQAEIANAIRLRNEGQLDARYHKRP